MKALIKKNKQYRKAFSKSEIDFYINSALINNKILRPDLKKILSDFSSQGESNQINQPYTITLQTGKKVNKFVATQRGAQKTQKKLPSTISKIRNICILTGRPRAVFLNYKVSRIKFKELAVAGYLPGVKKR